MECIPVLASPSVGHIDNHSSSTYDIYGYNFNTSGSNISFKNDGELPQDNYKDIERILFQKVVIIACAFGVFGNLLSLIILSRKSLTTSMERMEKSAHYGLMALVLSDLCLALIIMPHAWVDNTILFYPSGGFDLYYISYENALVNVFITCSTWLTVSLATSRYLAICHPLKARQILGSTISKTIIALVFMGSILFNLLKFWTFQVTSLECQGNWTVYYQIPGFLQEHSMLDKAHMWSYFIVVILIPTLVLASCNCNLIIALRKSLRMREQYRHNAARESHHRVTLMLVVIIVMHLLLFMPAEVITFMKYVVIADSSIADEFNLASAIANTLQAFNFSFNFLIYFAMNARFRHELGHLFCCSGKLRTRKSMYSPANAMSMAMTPQTV